MRVSIICNKCDMPMIKSAAYNCFTCMHCLASVTVMVKDKEDTQ